MFSSSSPNPDHPLPDPILSDLPRGEEGRRRNESFLPHHYFESPAEIAKMGFKDGSGQVYLGFVNAHTERVVRPDGRTENCVTGGTPVGVLDDRHMGDIAQNRSGKGRSAIIPTLLTYGASCLVIDPKGENCAVTARYRATALGQTVCILDPFNVTPARCAPYRKRFNPIAILTQLESATLVEDAGLIANALIVPSGNDPHWDDSAEAVLAGVIAHVATSHRFRPEERTLVTVADLLNGRRCTLDELLKDMLGNQSLDGYVLGAARRVQETPDKERGGIISNLRKNLRFLEFDAIRSVFSGNDFDLDDLKRYSGATGGKCRGLTVYLVLPAMRMSTCAQFLRVFVNMTLAAAERRAEKPRIPVLMVLDEFAVLGRMAELERAIGQVAGLGIRIWWIVQDLNQLKALYKDRWESFMANSGILRFYGVVDQFTSSWVSEYLDKTTITVVDANSTTADQKTNHGASGLTAKQQVVNLMTAAEVRRYFARDDHYNRALVLVPGRRPMIVQRAHYDQHPAFKNRFDAPQ